MARTARSPAPSLFGHLRYLTELMDSVLFRHITFLTKLGEHGMAGRPPIGNAAMSGAERQRRYWAKHKGAISALQAEIAAKGERIAKLEGALKWLKMNNQNLRAALDAKEARRTQGGIATAGAMPRATRIAIDKALHPDYTPSAADRNAACKGWNAWKNAHDKKGRKGRRA